MECFSSLIKGNADQSFCQGTYILSIDLGTSGPKVALLTVNGKVMASEFEPNRLILLEGGGAEQDPDDWWQAIVKATRRLMAKHEHLKNDIAAVSCTAQWSGTVAVDRHGRHLMNAIIWMDSRGASHVRRIVGGGVSIQGYEVRKLARWLYLTGGIPEQSGKGPVAHILFIKNTLPHIYRDTYKFLEPKDYLNLRLTGIFAASHDSIALHWVTDNRDISRIRYREDLITLTTIDADKLPELTPTASVLGIVTAETARELGINEGIPVVTGTPDVQSAAVGSCAVQDFDAHLYIGTSSWLTCHVPFKKTDVLNNMATLPSGLPGRYFIGNEQETAGECLDYLRDNILYPGDDLCQGCAPDNFYKLLEKTAASAPPGSGKVIFTPWLYGERTPIEDRTVRAGFFNQSLSTKRFHLVRAVYEGVAYNSRWLLESVESFIGKRLDKVTMIGGGARSELWCRIHADILGRPIHAVKDPVNANLKGAALLAGMALGLITVDDIASCRDIEATYMPDIKNRAVYEELFREFKQIYRKTKGIYRRLNA